MDVKNFLFSAILCALIKYKTVVSSRSYLLSTQLCDVRTGSSGKVCLRTVWPFSINAAFLLSGLTFYLPIDINQRSTSFWEKHCKDFMYPKI